MQNGENLQALHKNLEFIRFISILLLLIHFYSACYPTMVEWGIAVPFVTHLLYGLSKGLFFLSGINIPKLIALFLLALSLLGERGNKDNKLALRPIIALIGSGIFLFFLSSLFFLFRITEASISICYISVTSTGYLLILFGGARLSRFIHLKMGKDPFNLLEETFPQEERLMENEYSINLPAQYNLKGKIRKSWINIINPFRALLVLGTPGSR